MVLLSIVSAEDSRGCEKYMTRYLVIWKAVNARFPENTEDRVKQQIGFTQLVQEAVKSGGPLKEWATIPDGTMGYAIFDGSETDMAVMATLYVPHFEFETYPILNAEEFLGALKSVA
jgi:hypothetical protein